MPAQIAAEGWESLWDAEQQKQFWLQTSTGEIRARMPALMGGADAKEVARLRDARPMPAFRLRTLVVVGEGEVGSEEYRQFHAEHEAEVDVFRAQWAAATMLQKYYRRKLARELANFRRHRRDSANLIKRQVASLAMRNKTKRNARERRAATKLCAHFRMYNGAHFYRMYLWERLWWRRAERHLAKKLQRLWRGYVYRRDLRKLKIIQSREWNHAAWAKILPKAFPPRRSWGVFDENTFPGTRDVRFYANRLTDVCSWIQPADWKRLDYEEFLEREELRKHGFTKEEFKACVVLQNRWRQVNLRRDFKMVLQGSRIMDTCEDDYLNQPENSTAFANYCLYLHVFKHDYFRCRQMYAELARRMEQRGPDNTFVLYSYAIFQALVGDDDWDSIVNMAERARVADVDHLGRPTRKYALANAGFFRVAAIRLNTGAAWHNYALCRTLAFRDYTNAEELFVRAVQHGPHDKKIVENFDELLFRFRGVDRNSGVDAYSRAMDHQRGLMEAELLAREKRLKQMLNAPGGDSAATKIQMAFRRRGAGKSLAHATAAAQLEAERDKRREEERGAILREQQELDEMRSLLRSGHGARLWEECEAPDGQPFWYNSQTGESTWDEPADLDAVVAASRPPTAGSRASGDGGGRASLDGRLLLDDAGSLASALTAEDAVTWEVCEGDGGRVFYYNTATGESQWEEPAAVAAARARGEVIPSAGDADDDELASAGGASGGAAPGPLPAAWEECVGDDGKTFYYNTETGVSTWDRPDPDDEDDADDDAADDDDEYDDDDDEEEEDQEPLEEGPIGEGWEVALDPESGAYYFCNRETGETQWERPPVADAPAANAPAADAQSADAQAAEDSPDDDPEAAAAAVAPPPEEELPLGWEVVTDEEGYTFFYHAETGETTWERPEPP